MAEEERRSFKGRRRDGKRFDNQSDSREEKRFDRRPRRDFDRREERHRSSSNRSQRVNAPKTKMFGDFAAFYFGEEDQVVEKNKNREEENDKRAPRRNRPDRKDEKRTNDSGAPLSSQENLLPWQKGKSKPIDNREEKNPVRFEDLIGKSRVVEEKKVVRSEKRSRIVDPEKVESVENVMRLNKFIAKCGVCSRRKAAELVKEGLIKVNGKVELQPAYELQPKDVVEYEGRVLEKEEEKVYLLLNKPRGVITTVDDEKDRKTVMDLVENKVDVRIFPVGRLDRNTTGLLLLTNDGDLTKKLSHPSHRVQKFYHVVLDKDVTSQHLKLIANGLTLEDGFAQVDAVGYVDGQPKNEVGIEIHIGKNRIVRRIFEHLGYRVERLDRTYYAGLTKKDLPRGWSRFLSSREVVMLRHFIG